MGDERRSERDLHVSTTTTAVKSHRPPWRGPTKRSSNSQWYTAAPTSAYIGTGEDAEHKGKTKALNTRLCPMVRLSCPDVLACKFPLKGLRQTADPTAVQQVPSFLMIQQYDACDTTSARGRTKTPETASSGAWFGSAGSAGDGILHLNRRQWATTHREGYVRLVTWHQKPGSGHRWRQTQPHALTTANQATADTESGSLNGEAHQPPWRDNAPAEKWPPRPVAPLVRAANFNC